MMELKGVRKRTSLEKGGEKRQEKSSINPIHGSSIITHRASNTNLSVRINKTTHGVDTNRTKE